MKTISVLVLLSAAILATTPSYAQAPLIGDLFERGLRFPHGFDDVVAANKAHFNPKFYGCMAFIRNRVGAMEMSSDQQCMTHTNPQWYSKCLQENPFRNMAPGLADLETVTRGQASWRNTNTGSGAAAMWDILEAQIAQWDAEVMPGLVLLCGQACADAKRKEIRNSMNAMIDQRFQMLRAAMVCP